jgi:hypothetical protein
MLLDDNPATKDYFNYHKCIDTLTEVILNIKSTPYTIGIFGDWGSGKTTLMSFIKNKLKDKCKTIWFNPWKYDNKEEVWNALIQSILNEMKRDIEFQEAERADDLIKRIVKCGEKLAWYSIKIGANKLTGGILNDTFLDSLKKSFESNEKTYDFINKFEDTFSEIVNDYCEGKKLVIFIDDLDRCIPENAITVLESIKLYLDKSNCVFVLGLEKEIVEKGIHSRYKREIDYSGKDYLEKIIQLPFIIPKVKTEDIEQYVLGKHCPPILPSTNSNEFIKLILVGTDGNIRKVKRFINCFYILKLLSGIKPEDDVRHGILGKILLLQMRFPNFYKKLNRDNELLSDITKQINDGSNPDLSSFCMNEEEKHSLYNFLYETRDIYHTPKFVSECITLTLLTS